MALTALALLWLLWRLSGQGGLMIGAVAASTFLILAWAIGRKRPAGAGMAAIGLGLALSALAAPLLRGGTAADRADVQSILPSQTFSENRLAELRAGGKPVFVYFTADWCVTCKVNEAVVLEREATAKLFKADGIAVLRGDFTRRDPAIARFLASHGQAGVPLYLYYPKGEEAKLLPQILTQSILRETVKR
jgi:thiol:disulfide interchange protein